MIPLYFGARACNHDPNGVNYYTKKSDTFISKIRLLNEYFVITNYKNYYIVYIFLKNTFINLIHNEQDERC